METLAKSAVVSETRPFEDGALGKSKAEVERRVLDAMATHSVLPLIAKIGNQMDFNQFFVAILDLADARRLTWVEYTVLDNTLMSHARQRPPIKSGF